MAKSNEKKKYNYLTKTVTLPNGKRKYIYAKTKAELVEKVRAVQAEIAGGLLVDDSTTFGEVAQVWLDKYKKPAVRETTLRTITSMLNAIVMPRLGSLRVKDITPLHIQDLVAFMTDKGYTNSATVITHLRDIFSVAVELGCISRSPVSMSLKLPSPTTKKEKTVMGRELESELLRVLTPCSVERMFFMLAARTGMRRGEVYAINWDCIDLRKKVIKVRRNVIWERNGQPRIVNYGKSVSAMRDIPIADDLLKELKQWGEWKGVGGFIFGDHNDELTDCTANKTQTTWKHIRIAASKFNSEFAKGFTPHVLRHTWVTRMFEAGLDVKAIQVLAGHKDVTTTLGTYTHFASATRQDSTFEAARAAMRTEQTNDDNVIEFKQAAEA